jgi:hypothetical protein
MRWIITLLLTAALIGCDTADSGGSTAGTFTAQISGDLAKSFSGVASFGSVAEQEIFTLALSSTAGDMVSIAKPVSGRPATGSHPIRDVGTAIETDEFWATIVLLAEDVVFQSTSGTMQISSSGPQQLSGTISFDAFTADGREVVLSANFNAICGLPTAGSCD